MKKENSAVISLLIGMLILSSFGCKTEQTTQTVEKKNETTSSEKKSPTGDKPPASPANENAVKEANDLVKEATKLYKEAEEETKDILALAKLSGDVEINKKLDIRNKFRDAKQKFSDAANKYEEAQGQSNRSRAYGKWAEMIDVNTDVFDAADTVYLYKKERLSNPEAEEKLKTLTEKAGALKKEIDGLLADPTNQK